MTPRKVNIRRTDIDGKQWTKYSISIWDDILTKEEKKLKHPAMFPVSLVKKLIHIYSLEGELILDPLIGVGSTSVAAGVMNRKCIGFEINSNYYNLALSRLKEIGLLQHDLYMESCFQLEKYVMDKTIDLCITSPPYWDILNRKRSADRKQVINYGEDPDNLGNIKDYDKFLDKLEILISKVYKCLKPSKYFIMIVGDIRKKSTFYPFHIDLTKRMLNNGFQLEDFIIWDRRKAYNNLRPLGFPYVFRVNKVHEYICIYKKVEKDT